MNSGATPIAQAAIARIREEYLGADRPWIVGFSGGKDSSALIRLVFEALRDTGEVTVPVAVVYCDTGVEIPVVSQLVAETLDGVALEAQRDGLPLSVHKAEPRLADRYFVKVLGRGYPPPTNKFRWCTDRLRIGPVQRVLSEVATEGSLVLLGVRRGESAERDRILERHELEKPFHFSQSGVASSTVFAPILDFAVEDVWETVVLMEKPSALDGRKLWRLYGNASGEECPLIREPTASPCGKGRFGCWTCTVVRKDEAVAGLVESGHGYLAPLLAYRDWLQAMRDDPSNRCARRRNGAPGPGPLTLAARREALRRLRTAERTSGLSLLRTDETRLIHRLWREDRGSAKYEAIV